ncbi:zinc finger CCHC domain-containing protein 8 homolog [Musca vetustissima]|uniref:zinc finger CCHC domain-containing protein 8 homolog n=1 Tax=Musca vetustissima TaxID=27455 RepID=UPI002AB75EF1|nr:zinc finger CCHC domain-containing protein 8 homolog [Musca vetustissima]
MPGADASLNDSDCVLQEHSVSCITLDDSHEDAIEEGELDDDEDESSHDGNICRIIFTSENYAKFGCLIEECIKEKLNGRCENRKIEILPKEEDNSITLNVRYATDNENDSQLDEEQSATCKPDSFEKEDSPDLSGISELFTIDTTPAEKLDSIKIPSYKRAIKDALLDEEAAATKKQKQEEKNMKASKSNNCFNCGEADHNIRDCPMPHNIKRIKMAKKNFAKTERYHVDVEQRFAHLRPGNISDKLREAMGLRKGELPFFFYRMRVLGYPPGWLEDAKVEHSGINLFNSDGSKILNSDEDDGEVDANTHKYNVSKIIDFPGFNQDPGENFFDDYKYHNVPPMNRNQMKEEFVKTLGDNVVKGYKRKKLKDFPKSNADDSINDSNHIQISDMEIEDVEPSENVEFVRPPPPSDPPEIVEEIPPPPPPLPPPSPDRSMAPASPNSPDSPSLDELEVQKKQLLKALNTSDVEIDDSLVDEIIAIEDSIGDEATYNETSNEPPAEDDLSQEPDKDVNQQPGNAASQQSESNASQNSNEDSKDSCKSSETNNDNIDKTYMGTPVLKFSPYDSLPNGENFKVGVSDVINFENLPDSTGKYENMKELIKKVRTVIHKIHSDE